MILPTKHLTPARSLISVSSEVLELIGNRSSVCSVWSELQEKHKVALRFGDVPYDWFVLSLDFLFIIGAIEEQNGIIKKVKSNVKKSL